MSLKINQSHVIEIIKQQQCNNHVIIYKNGIYCLNNQYGQFWYLSNLFGNNSFIIHLWMSNNMLVYKFNQQSNVFTLSNSFLMEGEGQFVILFFRSLYIKQTQLSIKQDKNQLCLFLVNKDQELQLFQRIRFQEWHIWGTMSDNGFLLITWDQASKELKVISCFQN
ncbi:unnamed protein product [Paramecium primaurelia]|uniref:Uncharacterized protein n=1 Tax=Paramecium primaurelia TaxID=5886 RepID=A0A8S1L7G4_PARPR|nr:unnamed protein product [Paramecium primaurelia]